MSTVVKGQRMMFQESIPDFDRFAESPEVMQAKAIWDEFATDRLGQEEVFDAAKNGDQSAMTYIMYKVLPRLTSIFWSDTHLGPNKKYWQTRIADDAGQKFLAEVAEIIHNLGESGMRPTLNFKPDSVKEGVDLFAAYATYLTGYLRNRLTNINKASSSEDGHSDYDLHAKGKFDSRDHFGQTEDIDAWKNAVPFIKEDIDAAEALKLFLSKGLDFVMSKDASELGISQGTLKTRLGRAANILKDHGLDQASFSKLLPMASELAADL